MGSLIPRPHIHPGNEATTAHLESCKGPISIKGSQIEQHLPKLKRKQERATERKSEESCEWSCYKVFIDLTSSLLSSVATGESCLSSRWEGLGDREGEKRREREEGEKKEEKEKKGEEEERQERKEGEEESSSIWNAHKVTLHMHTDTQIHLEAVVWLLLWACY